MQRSLGFLLSILLFLPQCQKKSKGRVLHDTPVVNATGSRLKISIISPNQETKIFLNPNETKKVALPAKLVKVNARIHTKYGYKETSIKDLDRRIKKSRKLVFKGDDYKHFRAKVMHLDEEL